MDINQEIKEIRATLEDLIATVQVLSEKQNGQFTELMMAIKNLEDKMNSSTIVEANMDDLYEQAREIVIETGKASTSFLQRKLMIGYSRAAHLMDMLEDEEVIGPADGSNPRKVLVEE